MRLYVLESTPAVPKWLQRWLVSPLLPGDSCQSATLIFVLLSTLAAILFLAGCSSSSPSIQPPVLSYATTTAVYTKGAAITPDAPSDSGGAATSYTVAPALPAGLSLNTTTGVISGTPTAVAALAVYTVTASNTGGNGGAGLTITVNDIAPAGLSYNVNPAVYAVGAAISPNTPSWSATGGAPTSFTGSLPQGLSLDLATGIITGTPTGQAPQTIYTITATNTGGSTSAMLTLTVLPQAPFITVQPASQYVGSGIATSFEVIAGGGGILSYQWFKNNTAVGTNFDVYTTPVLSSADNGEQFHVVVSDNFNRSIPSNVATVTIKGVSGAFVNTGTPNVARGGHSATLLQNGMVLIAGGRNGNSSLASAELYDPATGAFSATGSLATARSGHSATLLQNGKVLIAGGYAVAGNSAPTIATAEIYDPGTGMFSATGSLGTGREGHSATLLTSGKVLVAGGATSTGFLFTTLASAELYDPVAGTFSATGSLNTARSAPATLLNNGQVLLEGGGSLSGGVLAVLTSAEIYDPTAGTFAFTGSLNTARANNSATLLQNGKVLIAGGTDSIGILLASAELYDPSAGTFATTGSLNLARSSPATLLSNGQVLVVGGNDISTGTPQPSLNMSELYDPASGVFILNAPTNAFRFFLTTTLLNNGKVLVTGQETSAIIVTQPVPSELY